MKIGRRFLFLIGLLFGLASCGNQHPSHPAHAVDLLSASHEGCFDGFGRAADWGTMDSGDTVYCIETPNDQLKLFIRKNYNCCGLLSDSVVVEHNQVQVFIADTCHVDCQCYCYCDFDFVYRFDDYQHQVTLFNIYLKPLGTTEFTKWKSISYVDVLVN